TEAGVPPDRRTIRTQSYLGLRELVDCLIDAPGGPVDEPRGVDGPRRFPRITHAGGVAHGGLRCGGGVDVVTRVREKMGELALDACDDQVARSALRRREESVLGAPRALQCVGDLVLRREDGRVAEVELREHQRVARGVLLCDRGELRGLLAANEVIGELEEIDRDARLEQRILYLRKDFVQLGPRQIEGLEVFETASAQDPPLERLTSARELRKEPFGVGTRERRERLVSQ